MNSVRVYEFFGYDWWLPLWDGEFVEFWQNVPLSLRYKRLWYNQYVDTVAAEVGLPMLGNGGQEKHGLISLMAKYAVPLVAKSTLISLYARFQDPSAIYDPLGISAGFQLRGKSLWKDVKGMNGVLARSFLDDFFDRKL